MKHTKFYSRPPFGRRPRSCCSSLRAGFNQEAFRSDMMDGASKSRIPLFFSPHEKWIYDQPVVYRFSSLAEKDEGNEIGSLCTTSATQRERERDGQNGQPISLRQYLSRWNLSPRSAPCSSSSPACLDSRRGSTTSRRRTDHLTFEKEFLTPPPHTTKSLPTIVVVFMVDPHRIVVIV